MDLRRARTFVTVAELGTVSQAALRLHVAQPALSRQIASLEDELGLRLFDRVGRRLVLTAGGEQLLEDCRHLLGSAESIRERARLLAGGDAGALKLAASPQFIETVLSGFLHRYRERYPKVQVTVVESISWPDTLGMLERCEIHLGQNLLRAVDPGDARFTAHPLEVVDLLAASAAPFAGSARRGLEIERLAAQPLLVLDSSFVSRRTLDTTCRLAGFTPSITFESRTPHTLLAMAEQGHGIAIVPSAVQTSRYTLHVVGITYRGERLRERLALFRDTRRALPAYATAFCTMLTSYAREVLPRAQAGPHGRRVRNEIPR